MHNNKIIVFFHIYYIHLIDEYLWYLNNIKTSNYDFDLYVSICSEIFNEDINKKLINFKSDVIITISVNRGADMGGFFHTIRNNNINLDLYCACMYLHTKESKQYGELISYQWRGQLLNDTLLTSELVNFCVDKIINKTGIIGSSKYIELINKSFNSNKNEMNHYTNLCNRLKLKSNNTYFVAGTIFWCNLEIIKYILKSDIMPTDFELGFEHSGLLAHGFERIFGNISTELNLEILGINLDIKSNIYHSNYKLYKENYKNNIIFKINNIISIPNEAEIKKILNKKLKLITSLIYIRNVK
jgi:lipopolysaccharide biosynthesis protein